MSSGSIAARVLPFGAYIAFLAVEPHAGTVFGALGFSGLDPRWIYLVKVGCVGGLLAYFWRDYRELARPGNARASDWILAAAAGLAVFFAWIRLDASWMVIGDSGAGFDPRTEGQIDWSLATARIAGAALVVPLMEELFWRSFVMRWIDRSDFLSVAPGAVSMRALSIASAIFAVEHREWFAGLVAGLVYAWLYVRSANLWLPVLAHAVTNAVLGVYVLATGKWGYW